MHPVFSELTPVDPADACDPFRVLYFPTAQAAATSAATAARCWMPRHRCASPSCSGRNVRRLYSRAKEIKTAYPGRVRIIGWTRKVPQLLTSHHLVVGKAGGATVHEAIAARCPMLIHHLVPGQEEGNLRLLEAIGGGALADTPEALTRQVSDLLADHAAGWRAMKHALARHDRNAGAIAAARFILNQIEIADLMIPSPTTPQSTIPSMTFLYDIGRVLLDFDFESSLARLLPPDCPNPHERLSHLLDRKDEFEAGAIDPDDYIDWALGVLGSRRHARGIPPRLAAHLHAQRADVGTRAASSPPPATASSSSPTPTPSTARGSSRAYPEFSLFDDAVLSFEVGVIKPHPQIYQHAVDTHELDPGSHPLHRRPAGKHRHRQRIRLPLPINTISRTTPPSNSWLASFPHLKSQISNLQLHVLPHHRRPHLQLPPLSRHREISLQ